MVTGELLTELLSVQQAVDVNSFEKNVSYIIGSGFLGDDF